MTAQAHRCVYAGRAAQQGEQKQGAFADAPFFPLRAPFVKEDREHPGKVDRGEVDQYNFSYVAPFFGPPAEAGQVLDQDSILSHF